MSNQNNQDQYIRLPLPKAEDEMFAIVNRKVGGPRMTVNCEDGKSRLARIPGGKRRKLRKIRKGDLLIISPWDIQDEKAEILHKYKRSQARYLSRKNMLPNQIDVF